MCIATICSDSTLKAVVIVSVAPPDMIRTYAATARGSDVVLHGFFVDGVLRGVDLRIYRAVLPARGGGRF
jgi:hypothetical protein